MKYRKLYDDNGLLCPEEMLESFRLCGVIRRMVRNVCTFLLRGRVKEELGLSRDRSSRHFGCFTFAWWSGCDAVLLRRDAAPCVHPTKSTIPHRLIWNHRRVRPFVPVCVCVCVCTNGDLDGADAMNPAFVLLASSPGMLGRESGWGRAQRPIKIV